MEGQQPRDDAAPTAATDGTAEAAGWVTSGPQRMLRIQRLPINVHIIALTQTGATPGGGGGGIQSYLGQYSFVEVAMAGSRSGS